MILASMRFKGFDTEKLLRNIQESLEQDLKKHPDVVLDSHKGELIKGNCSTCGETVIEILARGKARCKGCGQITKVVFDIEYT